MRGDIVGQFKVFVAKDMDGAFGVFEGEPELDGNDFYGTDMMIYDESMDNMLERAFVNSMEPGECREIEISVATRDVRKVRDADGEIREEVNLG